MLYRRFGRTEIEMPVFSCGGMRYQHKWQDVPLDEVPADVLGEVGRLLEERVAPGHDGHFLGEGGAMRLISFADSTACR